MSDESVFCVKITQKQELAMRLLARKGMAGLQEMEELIAEATTGRPESVKKACVMCVRNRCMCNELLSIFQAIDGPQGSQGNQLTAEGEALLADLEPLQEAMRKGIVAIKQKHSWIGEWNV